MSPDKSVECPIKLNKWKALILEQKVPGVLLLEQQGGEVGAAGGQLGQTLLELNSCFVCLEDFWQLENF